MSTKRSEIRRPQVDGQRAWDDLADSRKPGTRCGTCQACRLGLPGDVCDLDPRWAIEPQSDGRLYRKDGRTGLWERLP